MYAALEIHEDWVSPSLLFESKQDPMNVVRDRKRGKRVCPQREKVEREREREGNICLGSGACSANKRARKHNNWRHRTKISCMSLDYFVIPKIEIIF